VFKEDMTNLKDLPYPCTYQLRNAHGARHASKVYKTRDRVF
jgi:hypothetical protein